MIPGIFPVVSGQSKRATLTFLAAASEASSDGEFPAIDFGSEAPDRYLCAVFGITGGVIDTAPVTIGSVSASLVVFKTRINGSNVCSGAIFIAPVPTGTSGDVEIDLAGGARNISLALYSMTGLSNGGVASDTQTSDSATFPMSGTLTVPAGGCGIAGAFSSGGSGSSAPFDWTGLTAVDLNTRFASGNFNGTSAGHYTDSGGSIAITSEPQGSWSVASLVMASFV